VTLLAVLFLSTNFAYAQKLSFTVEPQGEIVLKGALGTLVNESFTLVSNSSKELSISTSFGSDSTIGIDLPKTIVLQPYEEVSFILSYLALHEAKGWITLAEGGMVQRIAIRGTMYDAPLEKISVPQYVTFGPTAPGEKTCLSIEVKNISTAALTIDYALAGYSNGAFNIPTDNIPRLTLEPGAVGSVSVCFEPKEYDSKEELVFNYSVDGGVTKEHRSSWLLGMIKRDDPTVDCLTTNEKVGIGPVMLGQSAEGKIYLANQTDKPIAITSATITGIAPQAYKLRESLPVVIDARSKAELTVVFTPEKEGNNSAELAFALESETADCKSAIVMLNGWTTDKVKEDSRYPIFLGERKTIGIEWGPNTIMQKVNFYNNLDHQVEIREVKLRDGIDFRIVQSTPTVPCFLKPDETFTLVLATGMDGKPYFTDEIIFVTDEDGASEQGHDVQGMKQSASVTDAGNSEIELMIGPNPAVADLNISVKNAASAVIMLHDMSGKPVAMSSAMNFTWRAPQQHASGTYFVTVSGITVSGKPFNLVRRVVVE
jgi:hypothetical protein